jgi:hypothetical protein
MKEEPQGDQTISMLQELRTWITKKEQQNIFQWVLVCLAMIIAALWLKRFDNTNEASNSLVLMLLVIMITIIIGQRMSRQLSVLSWIAVAFMACMGTHLVFEAWLPSLLKNQEGSSPAEKTSDSIPSEESDPGWIPYEKWILPGNIGSASDNYRYPNASFNLKYLFHYAYMREEGDDRISNSHIATYLFYYQKPEYSYNGREINPLHFIKLQRFTGTANTNWVNMYYSATSNSADNQPSFAIFHLQSDLPEPDTDFHSPSEISPEPDRHTLIQTVKGAQMDCLIVSLYTNNDGHLGTDFWVDTPKYSYGPAFVSFTVSSSRGFAEAADGLQTALLWELRPSPIIHQDTSPGAVIKLPLQFKQMSQQARAVTSLSDTEAASDLGKWLARLDDFHSHHPMKDGTKITNGTDYSARLLTRVLQDFQASDASNVTKLTDILDESKTKWAHHIYFTDVTTGNPVGITYTQTEKDN